MLFFKDLKFYVSYVLKSTWLLFCIFTADFQEIYEML